MEWLRSCYSSKWRLFRDAPTLETAGRYYFCPPHTPFLDSPHQYYSRNWHDNNYAIVQQLGESLTAKQAWFRGDPPPVLPRSRIVGSQQCIEEGELIENGLTTNDLHCGFNVECFFDTTPIDLAWETASSYNSCSLQYFYATVIMWLYRGRFARIVRAFELLLGPDAQCIFYERAGVIPAMVIVKMPTYSIVVTSGTSTYQQFALQAFYSLTGPRRISNFSTSRVWYDLATRIAIRLDENDVPAEQNLFLCGHSYGAAASAIMAARAQTAQPDQDIRWLLFGAPKVGDARLAELLAKTSGLSIANEDDYVCVLPPTLLQIIPVAQALGLPALRNFNQWQPTPFRTMLRRNGTLVPNGVPTLGYNDLLVYTGLAVLGLPVPRIFEHAIEIYRRRTGDRCPLAECPVSEELWEYLHLGDGVGLTAGRVPAGLITLSVAKTQAVGNVVFSFAKAPRGNVELGAAVAAQGKLGLTGPRPTYLIGLTAPSVASGRLVLSPPASVTLSSVELSGLSAPDRRNLTLGLRRLSYWTNGLIAMMGGVIFPGRVGLSSPRPAAGNVGLTVQSGDAPVLCPCCGESTPTAEAFTVRLTCPDVPELNEDLPCTLIGSSPGETCDWSNEFTPSNTSLEVFCGASDFGFMQVSMFGTVFLFGTWHTFTIDPATERGPMTCTPFYFNITVQVMLDFDPTPHAATLEVISVP